MQENISHACEVGISLKVNHQYIGAAVRWQASDTYTPTPFTTPRGENQMGQKNALRDQADYCWEIILFYFILLEGYCQPSWKALSS